MRRALFVNLSSFSRFYSTCLMSNVVSKSLLHPTAVLRSGAAPSLRLFSGQSGRGLGSFSFFKEPIVPFNTFSTSGFSKVDQESDADFQPKLKRPVSANINDVIKQQVESSDVVLYMKGSPSAPMCGFSFKVVQILNALGVDYQSYNVLADENLRQGIKQYSNWPTIPQLYVKGEFVGGCDIIENMYRSGELQALLSSYSKNTQSS
ncbi:hypothetical protein GAYE_SCF47G5936 [Galdieria yellowstonensis]|uniref:Uncharacterized monothiol glutaredoxin ycf64 n=1 Tax=Galdieria yellowstonensis TaxID=3028027 RepID=A0AAV9IL61_9RHOD|nr:hypothetical protein GAYE_SCF47G5936 [Galdieria yellowstonensis]